MSTVMAKGVSAEVNVTTNTGGTSGNHALRLSADLLSKDKKYLYSKKREQVAKCKIQVGQGLVGEYCWLKWSVSGL